MPKPTKLKPYRPLIKAFIELEKRLRGASGHITYSGREDGIGAQIHAVFSLYAYAHLRNLDYHNQPLKNISHNDTNASDWDQKWNEFFNLPTATDPRFKQLPAIDFQPKRVGRIRSNACYHAQRAHPVSDLFPEAYDVVMPTLKKHYYDSSFPKKSVFTGHEKQIAVHIRRGDALQHKGRTSNLETIHELLVTMEKFLKQHKQSFTITVFSQGAPEDFKELADIDLNYCLNGDLFDTFHSLVTADALVMARSSLSYAAALLSDGLIFYEPFWHPPMRHWQKVTSAPDKSFNQLLSVV